MIKIMFAFNMHACIIKQKEVCTMAENKLIEVVDTNNDKGTVTVANDVIAIIAGLAATEIDGVAGMSGGIVGGIAELLGRKNLAKGIKVSVVDKQVIVDVSMIVRYGVKINEVCYAVQDKIIDRVETMTGMKVEKVNVTVLGLEFPKDDSKAPANTDK